MKIVRAFATAMVLVVDQISNCIEQELFNSTIKAVVFNNLSGIYVQKRAKAFIEMRPIMSASITTARNKALELSGIRKIEINKCIKLS